MWQAQSRSWNSFWQCDPVLIYGIREAFTTAKEIRIQEYYVIYPQIIFICSLLSNM